MAQSNPINEKAILEKCLSGNLEEFGKLYDLYIKRIYNFIYYRTYHRQTTEDLTSKTFFKALNNLKNFDQDHGEFSSWLYQIARNTLIDHYRTAKDNVNINDLWDLSTNENLQHDLENKESLRSVGKYLKDLPQEHREIIIMRIWDNLPYEKIAIITGKTQAGCKMMFSRAMTKLRSTLAQQIIALTIFAIYQNLYG